MSNGERSRRTGRTWLAWDPRDAPISWTPPAGQKTGRSPERYLASHAVKWGRGRTGRQYAQWAYDIKNRAGVRVCAYIHPIHGNRGIAFVDLEQDAIVQFDCDVNQNFDCLTPPSGARRWIADKLALGTHWRLHDTER